MDNFSRDTSPDPLALAISPPTSHARTSKSPSRSRSRSPTKPLATLSSNVFVTPSKKVLMDTAKRGDNCSPWRIKVTVEAEPQDGSPTPRRRTRITTVPLRGSSSPARKPLRRTPGAKGEGEPKLAARKRKGTPIRRTPKAQPPPAMNPEPTTDEDDVLSDRAYFRQSPSRTSGGRKTRQSLPKLSTRRYGRLSQAREELDEALQAALGDRQTSQSSADMPLTSDTFGSESAAGDMTVSMNEDFTMISVESLESYRKHALNHTVGQEPAANNTLNAVDEEEVSAREIPSSPPSNNAVQYPDLSTHTEQAELAMTRQQSLVHEYDAMSWKPTGQSRNLGSVQQSPAKQTSAATTDEPTAWRLEGKAVTREIQDASTSQLVVVDDTTAHATPDNDNDQDEDDADIWQEEASRSMEEDQKPAVQHREPTRAADMDDFFADQHIKPLRSKIPRTWRRISGADFSYSDSPEHPSNRVVERVTGEGLRKTSAGDTGDEDGILTPPTTDDEVAKQTTEAEEVDSSDLTEPDAAATQLQHEPVQHAKPGPSDQRKADFSPLLQHRRVNQGREHVPGPLATSGSSSEEVTSPDDEDSGYFWQNNMPHVYNRRPQRPRPKRKSAMDLSDLLNLKSSPEKGKQPQRSSKPFTTRTSPNVVQASNGFAGQAPVGIVREPTRSNDNKLINTPLRKSLLKSSKLGSPVGQTTQSAASSSFREGDTFESKTSDQRQLLNEVNATPHQLSSSPSSFYDVEDRSEEEHHGFSVPDDESSLREEFSYRQNTFQSYEEHLNLDSPTKIKVKFNDSTVESSALAPSKQYPSLFGRSAAPAKPLQHSPGTLTLVSKRETQPGIFSRLSSNFWQAVVRPTGPTEIIPPPPEPEPEYPARLRAHIRRRYGVVPNIHPWTMVHMRTLHRMENSRTSGKSDSIIPKKGPLPTFLRPLVGTRQISVGDYEFTLCAERAHVVAAMMQTLVHPELVKSMEAGDIDFLGDRSARQYRETDELGRRGTDSPYAGGDVYEPAPGRPIDGWFIMKALGDCVQANEAAERGEE